MLFVANTRRHFFTSILWTRILYIVHGTRLLLVSKCSAECLLAASEVTVPLQLPTENGPRFRTPQFVVGKGRQLAVGDKNCSCIRAMSDFLAVQKVRIT